MINILRCIFILFIILSTASCLHYRYYSELPFKIESDIPDQNQNMDLHINKMFDIESGTRLISYNDAVISYVYLDDIININIIFDNAPIVLRIEAEEMILPPFIKKSIAYSYNIKACSSIYPGNITIYVRSKNSYLRQIDLENIYKNIDFDKSKIYFSKDQKKIPHIYATSSYIKYEYDHYREEYYHFIESNIDSRIKSNTILHKFYFDLLCGDLEDSIFVLDGISIDGVKLPPVRFKLNYHHPAIVKGVFIYDEYVSKEQKF